MQDIGTPLSEINNSSSYFGTPIQTQNDQTIQNTICLSNLNQARASYGLDPVSFNLQVECITNNKVAKLTKLIIT